MKKTFVILLICLLVSACERDNGNFCQQLGYDSSGYIEFSTINDIANDSLEIWLSATDTVFWWKREQIFYVINDQKTFEKLVRTNRDSVNFNFNDFTLLIGYVFIHSGPAEIIDQRVSVYCDTYEQSVGYRVIIESEHVDHGPLLIQFHAIVTKIPDEIPISCGIDVDFNMSN